MDMKERTPRKQLVAITWMQEVIEKIKHSAWLAIQLYMAHVLLDTSFIVHRIESPNRWLTGGVLLRVWTMLWAG